MKADNLGEVNTRVSYRSYAAADVPAHVEDLDLTPTRRRQKSTKTNRGAAKDPDHFSTRRVQRSVSFYHINVKQRTAIRYAYAPRQKGCPTAFWVLKN